MKVEEIKNVHFLSYRKPWTLLLGKGIQYEDTVVRMKECPFVGKFYSLWLKTYNEVEKNIAEKGLSIKSCVKKTDIEKI